VHSLVSHFSVSLSFAQSLGLGQHLYSVMQVQLSLSVKIGSMFKLPSHVFTIPLFLQSEHSFRPHFCLFSISLLLISSCKKVDYGIRWTIGETKSLIYSHRNVSSLHLFWRSKEGKDSREQKFIYKFLEW
jgi:hypothetical protein